MKKLSIILLSGLIVCLKAQLFSDINYLNEISDSFNFEED